MLSDVGDVTRLQTEMGRVEYLLTQFTVVARYLGLVVFPAGQTLDHDLPVRSTLADPAVLGAAGAARRAGRSRAAAALGCVAAANAKPLDPAVRLAALGIGWFFLALSVESSFIPIVDVMFEHRVYLPMAGLSMTMATLLALACRRLAPRRAVAATVGVAAAVAVLLGAVTWTRNALWTSPEAIWRDAVLKSPAKARPRHNLGVILLKAGRLAEALPWLQQAVALDPRWSLAHESLGVALSQAGRVGEAQAHFERAIVLAPEFADQWYDLGVEFLQARSYAEAVPCFEKALKLQRPYPNAVASLAVALNRLGRSRDAVRLLRESRDEIRTHAAARAQLAIGAGAAGRPRRRLGGGRGHPAALTSDRGGGPGVPPGAGPAAPVGGCLHTVRFTVADGLALILASRYQMNFADVAVNDDPGLPVIHWPFWVAIQMGVAFY